MVCTGVLTGLLLFSLFSVSVLAAEVDPNTLAKIIQFFENNYKPEETTSTGDGAQYAVAINVPADQCGANFQENSFLSGEDKKKVKDDLAERNRRLYQGQQLVAAREKGASKTSKIHSERALLMCEGISQAVTPVQNLLNKDKNGCVVFYTYNSPCLEYCLDQDKDKNEENWEKVQRERGRTDVKPAVKKCILNSLSMLTNHGGPKAFVFSKVYREDKGNSELEPSLKQIAEKVPLYKCTTNSCVKCLESNQVFNNQCLS